MAKEKKCCICGKPFDDEYKMGNNAQPFSDGWCCNKCNKKYVIPSRVFASILRGKMIKLFKLKQKEIELGEWELSYNMQYSFGYILQDKGDPRKFKEWKREFFTNLCKNDEEIKEMETKLITAAKSKLKDSNDVWIDYKAEKSDYLVYLKNFSSKHLR